MCFVGIIGGEGPDGERLFLLKPRGTTLRDLFKMHKWQWPSSLILGGIFSIQIRVLALMGGRDGVFQTRTHAGKHLSSCISIYI